MGQQFYEAVGYVWHKYGQPELRIRREELLRLAGAEKKRLGAVSFTYENTNDGYIKVIARAPILE